MTDRVKALTVILEEDTRTDDVEPLIEAIKQLRGVLSVKEIITDSTDFIERDRIRRELVDKLFKVLEE